MDDLPSHEHCPLCDGQKHAAFFEDKYRVYLRCFQCYLVFVPAAYHLTAEEEKAEYDLHDNQISDAGYQRFLNRLWQPLSECLLQSSDILEFGCGPGPALAKMMTDSGMKVSLYDHFYYPDRSVLKEAAFDAVTSTEVIEHLHAPRQVFEQWMHWLKPNGHLGLMTKLVKDQKAFAQWHYKNDRTHVCFFSVETFQWLAKRYELGLQFHGPDVMIFQKA